METLINKKIFEFWRRNEIYYKDDKELIELIAKKFKIQIKEVKKIIKYFQNDK